jgi:benzoylformate decarboxylase
VHVAPGLGNAMGSLYNAKFTGTPMILTAGQQEQGHGLMEPLLYDPLVPIAAPLVKWAIEVTRLEDLPRIMHRAAKIAMTPPTGPVFLSLPGDILNAQAGIDLGRATRVDSRVRPSDGALAALAERILKAERPLIIAGDEIVKSDALAVAARFAETIGAAAMQQTISYGAHFLSASPCFMGALTRDQSDVRAVLSGYDLLIVLGADPLRMSVWSTVDPMPDGLAMLQIGLVDGELAKNYPAEMALRADVRETLLALLPVLEKKGGTALKERARRRIAGMAATNWTAKRARLVEAIEPRSATTPIDVDVMTLRLVDALPKDVILVNEGLTTSRRISDLFAYRDRYGFHGLASGGIGWSLPASAGIAMAQPGRPVVTCVGDGSAMYSIQALWTIAHHKLPVTTVICNNGGYRIIKQRLKSFHGNEQYVGMDFAEPSVDFVGLATAIHCSMSWSMDGCDAPTAAQP